MICWHAPYDRCSAKHHGEQHFYYGRCRSGQRWFWAVREFDGEHAHGWASTDDEALDEARAAVVRLAAGRPATAFVQHAHATDALKAINAEKRKTRPASGTSEATAVEYLYGETWDEEMVHSVVAFQVTKKTAKRIYYIRRERIPGDVEIGFVDRQKLEAKGDVYRAGRWWDTDARLYLEPPEREQRQGALDLAQLKAEMTAAHPDRGGTNEAFIAAHQRYKRALAAQSVATP
ncbi:MAG: hypothetical protein JWO67_6851 [Streptosporangiaceae bacterium]|nr:hypothetical protein [Streptosporangiaceae bacterium]